MEEKESPDLQEIHDRLPKRCWDREKKMDVNSYRTICLLRCHNNENWEQDSEDATEQQWKQVNRLYGRTSIWQRGEWKSCRRASLEDPSLLLKAPQPDPEAQGLVPGWEGRPIRVHFWQHISHTDSAVERSQDAREGVELYKHRKQGPDGTHPAAQ